MATEDFKRKLTAILSADVKGYSRLMGEDEEATVRTITAHRKVITSVIEKYRGRVVDSPGDNLLAEFVSVVDAVQGAVEIQEVIRAKNAELLEERRMEFRIGINLGDVIQEGERIYGDGVNIAARVEGLADPGGICISGSAYEQIENKLALGYDYIGEHTVRNIVKPIRVYKVPTGPETLQKVIEEKRVAPKWQRAAVAVVIALLVVAGDVAIWNSYRPSTATVTIITGGVNHFPGATWEFKTPAEVGLDSGKLDQFAANVRGVGCIVKDGYMVKTWGDQSDRADWGSALKPVTSTLLFFAVHEGLLDSVDELVKDWGWALNDKDQNMTFRHLANMVSGYARAEVPGAAWTYNNYAIKLYSLTLEKVFQQSLDDTALQRFAPLQFQDGSLFTSRGGHGISTTPRDFARIGWFWLNKGNWNGTQLLPRSYFEDYMRPGVPGDLPRTTAATSDYLGIGTVGGGSDQTVYGPGIYGFHWWFNAKVGTSDVLTWPDAPLDTFQANGHWDREVITIIPSLNMVVAARGNWGSFTPGDADAGMNQNLKLLVEAAAGNVAPTAETQSLTAMEDTPLDITLSYFDPDGPGPHTFSIVELPSTIPNVYFSLFDSCMITLRAESRPDPFSFHYIMGL